MTFVRTLSLAALVAFASAVKITNETQQKCMSLDADLSVPLSVNLGEAKFSGRACGCDCPELVTTQTIVNDNTEPVTTDTIDQDTTRLLDFE